ncbi:DUF155-domain-containing protein [Auricularia subglabra TFB-10046 SS5]|uniref:DUF155-domain-containing protein n=1 Tax=Auricularia subglabra (strain TFB-10046 / SS5) TaxID=717982 RepID=J0WWN1_AURST|nr:DUF155-domain-containing protein [Auricularia subglabra TFB-10046 SS5]
MPGVRERKLSIGATVAADATKVQARTTKTAQKHVVLPSEAQTKPLPARADDEESFAHSRAERMTKEQREQEGFRRLTAYCVADGFKMKLLAAFLKREHAVSPRIYDEALYAMYHLPLLPGYSQEANVRSSLPPKTPGGKTMLGNMTDAEELGYEGTYFAGQTDYTTDPEGFIPSSSPPVPTTLRQRKKQQSTPVEATNDFLLEEMTSDVIFFQYGVVVFYGLDEEQERSILEDTINAGIWIGARDDERWEIEQCHYIHDPSVDYPRIYNDFFTLKSRSHLLKLSISHAIAQSTLLATFETSTQSVLSHPSTVSIPRRLASAGSLRLHRSEAMRLTGRLFKLRRDVNLVSNVLDTPELFWSEASLVGLYDAVREYFEIGPRVQVLNEKLKVASDLLDIIHEHLNNGAMERITWTIIWLIVVACIVEFSEVLARLVVDARRSGHHAGAADVVMTAATSAAQPWRLMKRVVTPSPVRLVARIISGSFGSPSA